MKEFWKRAGLFAAVNAVIIILLMLITRLPSDSCIIYGSLCSIILGLPWEIFTAMKADRRPDISGGWGAAIFGALVMAGIIFVILLSSGAIK